MGSDIAIVDCRLIIKWQNFERGQESKQRIAVLIRSAAFGRAVFEFGDGDGGDRHIADDASVITGQEIKVDGGITLRTGAGV